MAKSKTASLEVAEADVEIQQVEAEFQELEEYFGDMGLDEGAEVAESDALSELDEAIKGTEFETSGPEAGAGLSFIEFADGAEETQEFSLPKWFPNPFNVLKNKARKIINRLKNLVKKYKKYASCIPLVTKAVVAFKAGKYGTALAAAWSALKCIRSK